MTRVLLVESGRDLRSLAAALVGAGFELALEESGPEAVDRLTTFHPDVIVLNLDPEPGLIRQLRSASPEAGVLGVVAAAHAGGERVRPFDADAVVDRPLHAADLIDAIWQLVEARAATDTSREVSEKVRGRIDG